MFEGRGRTMHFCKSEAPVPWNITSRSVCGGHAERAGKDRQKYHLQDPTLSLKHPLACCVRSRQRPDTSLGLLTGVHFSAGQCLCLQPRLEKKKTHPEPLKKKNRTNPTHSGINWN